MTTQMTQKRLVSGAMGFLVALGCGVSAFHGYGEDEAMEKLLKALKERGSISDAEYGDILKASKKSAVSLQGGAAEVSLGGRSVSQELLAQRKAIEEIRAMKGVDLKSSLKDKWYEKLSIRGYVQTRYTTLMSGEGRGALETFNDPTLKNNNQLLLRRGRMIFSGDAAEHVYLYAQIDYQASVGATSTSSGSLGGQRTGLQTRDLYADISIDKDKEHRFRLGISKVPYGWVNLQSSQNRLSIERPDALNSAVEGERDLGFYYMWADKEARQRFRDLVRTGLKGSGDYGVFAFGAYNGQTLNQNDANRNQHLIARLTYPFRLDNGQYIEAGFGGYAGRVVVPPTDTLIKEYTDRRASAHFILYPQPFGIEAEWTVGEGPENIENNVISTKDSATKDFNSVGVGSLQGGYVTASYKIDSSAGTVIPFSRWQYFDGARKLGNYAPKMKVNEVDFGIEYQPWPEFEIAAIYTRAFERTSSGSSWNNTIFKDQDRFTLHMQFNY
jgi:hypothetical protein